MTRPHVLHLLDDGGLGGVTRHVEALMASPLADSLDMAVCPVDARRPLAPRLSADLLHVHITANWRKLPWLATLRARHPGVPIILEEHSYTAAYEAARVPARKRARFRAMLRLSHGLADRVVAVSRGQGDWLRDLGLAPGRLVSLPTALPTDGLEGLPVPTPGGGPLVVGAYGRYADQKGFDVLIDAFRHVGPAHARLVLGGLGPDEAALRDRAAGLPNVHVGGAVSDVAGFLSGVDVVAIPSRWEAFGLVGLEARAAGRPILVSALDGLPEQTEGGAGWAVARHDDPAAWADAVRSVTPERIAAASAVARAGATGAWGRHVAAWRSLYADVLDARAARKGS